MFRILLLAAPAALLSLPALACDGFSVEGGYVRSSTAMSTSGAGFMTLVNQGTSDCRLVGARTEAAARAELHTHQIDANGVARMMQVEEGFAIPAGGTHALERGADHLMLMGLTAPLTQGQTVAVTFVFEDGSEASAELPVDNERMPGAMGSGSMGGMGHSHGN
ncbi:copper chaperone PCu(A)C [Pararhodobacter aggregans]|uniref:copper chaperone PCu(A)C n=1 Tax=Pararhodobacter aggregans TaxID=404875 RepID=UPI003A8E5945